MTALAAIFGVLGIGIGWWWTDAVAAGLISLDFLKDGWRQTKDAVTGLVNRSPTSLEKEYLKLPEKVKESLLEFPWVEKAQVRLYEHGHLIYGEGFIAPRQNRNVSPDNIREAIQKIKILDWRLQNFTLTVMPEDDVQAS